MRALRRHRLATCWIALVAILAGVLLPSFSMGAAGGGRLAWVEVCTALGAKRVPVPAEWAGGDIVASGATNALAPGAAGDEPAPHSPPEHCPWCTVSPEPLTSDAVAPGPLARTARQPPTVNAHGAPSQGHRTNRSIPAMRHVQEFSMPSPDPVMRLMRLMTHFNIGAALATAAWVLWSGAQIVTGQIAPAHRPDDVRRQMDARRAGLPEAPPMALVPVTSLTAAQAHQHCHGAGALASPPARATEADL